MAFLRVNPFYRAYNIQKRTFSFGLLGLYKTSFRDTLPKFPYPSEENVSRHQIVQPRPAPIKPDALNDSKPKKLTKPSMTDPTSKSVSPFPFVRPTRRADPLPDNSDDKANEKSVSVMVKQLKFQRQLRQIQDKLQAEQAKLKGPDQYTEKVFKIQHKNMQTIKARDREMRKQHRMNDLMQLQQKTDQVNTDRNDNEVHYASHRELTNDYLSPTQNSNYSCYVPRYKHEMPDFGTYTPVNSESDNCDISAKTRDLNSNPAASSHPPRLDEQMPRRTPGHYNKESAMCLLCKDALKAKAKY